MNLLNIRGFCLGSSCMFVATCKTSYMHATCLSALGLRVHSIGKSGFRFWKSKSGFPNRMRNSKMDFISREIRPQGGFQLRNPDPDFLNFPLCRSIGKSEKGSAKLFSWTADYLVLIMHTHRCSTRKLSQNTQRGRSGEFYLLSPWNKCRLLQNLSISHFNISYEATMGSRADF